MEINWGIVVSILSLLITIYTIIRTNAKSEEKMQGEIAVIKNDVKHLTEKVDKHNQVIERTYELETQVDILKEKQGVANHRIADLEEDNKKLTDKMSNMTRRNGI